MAQSNNRPNGCASGVIRAFGAVLLLGGLGNAFSGDGMGGIIVAIIGAAMLFGGLGKKNAKYRTPVMTASSRMPSSPEARMHAEKAAEAAERARQLRARQQQSAERARQRQSAQQPRQTAPGLSFFYLYFSNRFCFFQRYPVHNIHDSRYHNNQDTHHSQHI